MRKSVALLAAIFSSLFFAEALLAAPLRITDSTGQDISPVWEPNGNRIVYVGSSRVDLQACKLEYSIVSPK